MKIVVYLVHIQEMSDFFKRRETVKALLFVIWIHRLNENVKVSLISNEEQCLHKVESNRHQMVV